MGQEVFHNGGRNGEKSLPLADTTSGPVQKGHDGVVAGGAAGVVGHLAAGLLVDVDPALGAELHGVGAPELGAAVDGPGHDVDGRAHGKFLVGQRGLLDDLAGRDGHGRVQPQGLVADGVEEREGVDGGGGDLGVEVGGRGERVADFVAEALLDFWVAG